MKTIPVHEPEVIAAGAARMGGDDKVDTTSPGRIKVRGVEIDSRYSKAHELQRMGELVESMSADAVRNMLSIFCDSKCGSCYTVEMRGNDLRAAEDIGEQMERFLAGTTGGHNGIYIDAQNARHDYVLTLGPDWNEPDGY